MVVEGQTEEAFVEQVLRPWLWADDVDVQPIVVSTSRAASGAKHKGGGAWKHYRMDLQNLLGQPHWSTVGVLLDFYGYPADAPGIDCARPHSPRACAAHRVSAIEQSFADRRLRAHVMLHEFETLVFAAAMDRSSLLSSTAAATALQREASEVDGDVELLNDSPATAPSKRLDRVWPEYSKVTDGVAAVMEAGIDQVLARCPGLAGWVAGL